MSIIYLFVLRILWVGFIKYVKSFMSKIHIAVGGKQYHGNIHGICSMVGKNDMSRIY